MSELQPGTLYLVPTPIGNLQDITERAISILKEADVIAAEDTRHTRILLDHLGIAGHVVSYHEHNKKEAGPKIIAMLEEGKTVAQVSDATSGPQCGIDCFGGFWFGCAAICLYRILAKDHSEAEKAFD